MARASSLAHIMSQRLVRPSLPSIMAISRSRVVGPVAGNGAVAPHTTRAALPKTPRSSIGHKEISKHLAFHHEQEVAANLANVAALERAEVNRSLQMQQDLTRNMQQERSELLDYVRTVAQERAEIKEALRKASEERDDLRQQVEKMSSEFSDVLAKLSTEMVGLHARVERAGASSTGAQGRKILRPTLEFAGRQPTHISEFGHQSLGELAVKGVHAAHRERLLREIMAVDQVSWEEAHKVLEKLNGCNERYYWLESLPYRIGICLAFAGGVGSVLLVFSPGIAYWYGVSVAGEDLPEGVQEVGHMTLNQVGTWTWGWMEPMIGTASFILLCCQFARAQAIKMNMKTYAEMLLQWRANRVAARYPQYDRSIVRAWAKHMPRVDMRFLPNYQQEICLKGPTTGL